MPAALEEGRPPRARARRRIRVADRRGLTTAGAAVVATVAAAVGALVDGVTGSAPGVATAVGLILGCLFAALTVHREEALATAVLPPLVAGAVCGAIAVVATRGSGGVSTIVLQAGSALVAAAPALLVATGLCLVVALLRRAGGRF